MPVITCLKCGREISMADTVCQRCGQPAETLLMHRLGTYVGENWDSHYRKQFQRLLAAEKAGTDAGWVWNWSAALTPFWFLYRRLYGAFFLYALLHLVLGFMGLNLLVAVVQGCQADRMLYRKARGVARLDGGDCNLAWLVSRGRPHAWVPWVPIAAPPAFLIAVLGFSGADREFAQDPQTFTPAEAPAEAPAAAFRVVTSRDGQTQVTVPGTWQTLPSANERMQIKAGNVGADQLVATFTEAKADLPPSMSLEWYTQVQLNHVRQSMGDVAVSEPSPLRIGGNAAIQYEITDPSVFPPMVHWVTMIETPQGFHRVNATAGPDRTEASEQLVRGVILSFQETPQ